MRVRCSNPNVPNYAYYGGRGIKVCRRWDKFENFLADMGERPAGTSLDRIDNNGNYTPKNCRWATLIEQARNKRNNRLITFGEETLPLAAWAERIGISKQLLRQRLKYGWPTSKVLSPARAYKRAA
jgi:hypothetical protein